MIEGVNVRVLPALQSRPSSSDASLGVLPTLLAEHEVVIVHNLFTMPFNLPVTRLLRQLAVEWNKVHWVNWVHDVAAVNPNYAHLPWDDDEHRILKQPAPNCTNVAVSEVRRREYLGLLRLPDSACRVIPNGVDAAKILNLTPRVEALVGALRIWERDYVLLHPARILRRKNIELSLRITHALAQMGLDVALLITGAPDPHNADGLHYAGELRDVIDELGLHESARFLGEAETLADDDVRGLYAVADALLFPSTSEGFGLPIIEAALHGVPVFCSDIAAHREVGQNVARFFALNDEPSAIAQLITEHPTVTERYVRRATLAASLDWSAIYRDHLSELLEG
jgi:glycosyltransferase involved in cell wall biosynthesis